MMMMSLSAAIILDRSSLHVCTDDEQTNILIPQLQTHSSGLESLNVIAFLCFQRHHIVRMARVCAWGTVMLLRARDLQMFCTTASCNALTLANGWNQTWIVRYLFTRYLITVWRKPKISIVFYSRTQSDVVKFSATKHHVNVISWPCILLEYLHFSHDDRRRLILRSSGS
jgi:hypothetical protein